MESSEKLLEFWFADVTSSPASAAARSEVWFGGATAFDRDCRMRFGALLERAGRGELEAWRGGPRSALALAVLLDQIPRNVFRGTPRAFEFDARALATAAAAYDAGFDAGLHPIEASFLYMPFQHAEDAPMQERGVAAFEALVARTAPGFRELVAGYADYARRHREVIRRFGRFPHRNAVVERASTLDEQAYLRGGGETFGG